MNETPDVPAPPPASGPGGFRPVAASSSPAESSHPADPRTPWMPLLALAIVILAASNAGLWWQASNPPAHPAAADPTPALAAIGARLQRLEQAPQPDTAPVLARIDALEQRLNRPTAEAEPGALAARLDTLDQRLSGYLGTLQTRLQSLEQKPSTGQDGLQARVEALEQRRMTDPVALQARVVAMEQKVAADQEATAARVDAIEKASVRDLSAVTGRVVALEQKAREEQRALSTRIETLEKRAVPNLTPLEEQIAALEKRPVADPRTPDRLDAVSGRLEGVTARIAEDGRRLDATDARLAKVEAGATQVAALAERATRLARLRGAEAALAGGHKLGALPDAPPALARFADVNPPTEAGLRLSFPVMERAVRAAHRPDVDGKPFSTRVWDRVQDLVTVRQGDQVLIGDGVIGTLAKAQTALDAGDLAGVVQALGALTAEPAQAAAGWLADAKALLDARAALATMAARG